jgi:hypothetical protein
MTLLDRFRAQPPDKHPDPAVRLRFVADLPLDDRATIATVAREDVDPRVRRAAVAKLLDPALLGPIAQGDADESVRAQALEMLRDVALEAFEGTTESDSHAAVDEIARVAQPRALGQIAKSATRTEVAQRAVVRIDDVRTLGSIARHALDESARRTAFERLRERGETSEMLGVALNAEFKDVAVAAVDQCANRTDLQQIALRSRNKSAAKRATGLLGEMDERLAREAAEAVQAARLAAEAITSSVKTTMSDTQMSLMSTMSAVSSPADAEGLEAQRLLDEQAAAAEALERARQEAAAAERARVAAEAEASVRLREQQAREADARTRQEGTQRVQSLLARVEPLSSKADLSLKAAERALRDVRAALADPPPLSRQVDASAFLARLSAVRDALAPKVSELRETDEWQKWANVTIQEQLCAKMEGLATLEDPETVARQVRELQEQWRAAADVPRDKADGLWRRFKTAHDAVWTRCEAHFAAEAQTRAENLAKKIACCEQAEALAESTHWIQTAEAVKKLQADWKTIGPVSRGREKEVWDRFRTACDRFFTRRHDDLAARKTIWTENLAKKDALCARAEALALSTDWDQAAAEIKKLQSEWRSIGPVRKSRSEAVWQRFRAAGDRFFDRYTHRHEAAHAERVAAREAICAELEGLAAAAIPNVESADAASEDGAVSERQAPGDLLANVQSLRTKWRQEVAMRGVDIDRARTLDARFASAMALVVASVPSAFAGTELDPDANRQRMEALVKKVEDLARALAGPAASPDAALSSSSRLAAMLKEALAANTIGGRVEDDSRLRAAAADLAQAQTAWSQVGEVPDEVRRPLADRFQRAARQITDRVGPGPRSEGGARTQGDSGSSGRPRDARRPPPRRSTTRS